MKRVIENSYRSHADANDKSYQPELEARDNPTWLLKVGLLFFMLWLTMTCLHAQSGGWDGWATVGTAGNNDYGNGVIRLLSDVNTGCAGAAVHETTATYDPSSGTTFSKCYQVFFGCPGADNIGSDVNGDGMAFSFWKSSATYNINNGLACGGGLGYMGSTSDSKMITIEFDTWSSQGNTGFDNTYGGGLTGNNDEIALHRDGNASDVGRVIASNAGNLEDGLEHTVCITYTPGTHLLAVTIDGVSKFTYDLTGSPYDLLTYFGAGALNQTWSSGKFGATNPSTVTNGANITANLGGVPLCPAGVEITSPSDGAVFNGCPVGPITINATPTPPAGNTTTYVEFFVDGVSIGTDNVANYAVTWASPTTGNHDLTTVAHWSGGATSTSLPVNINVGGVQKTSTAPVIDGTKEALWNSYSAATLTKSNGATGADLGATYRMTYDNTNLYLLVDVTDDDLRNDSGNDWEDDAVEIYIDMGNDKAGTYGLNDYQFVFAWNATATPGIAETKHGATGGVNAKQTLKAGGYIMEIAIPWSTIGTMPTAGSSMGFDVSVNDDDGGGTRDNQLSWKDGTYSEFNNPSLFGTVQFTSCDPLPVSFVAFTGKLTGGNVVLKWLTASEINNDRFVIERSANATQWEAIGEVKGAGNSTSLTPYGFTDYVPLNGVSYYRLRQVDINGAFVYSNIVVIQTEDQPVIVLVAPNPFDEVLTIRSNTDEELEISIYDILGRIMYHANEKSEGGLWMIQPNLPTGTYIITVQTKTIVHQQKLIKK